MSVDARLPWPVSPGASGGAVGPGYCGVGVETQPDCISCCDAKLGSDFIEQRSSGLWVFGVQRPDVVVGHSAARRGFGFGDQIPSMFEEHYLYGVNWVMQ